MKNGSNMNLENFISRLSKQESSNIVFSKYRISFPDLVNEAEKKLSVIIAEGINPGEVILLASPTHPETICWSLAFFLNKNILFYIGETEINLDSLRKISGATYLIDPVKNKVKNYKEPVHTHPLIAKLQSEKLPGFIITSSGTSGEPKVILYNLEKFLEKYLFKIRKAENDTLLLYSLDHIAGIDVFFRTLVSGQNLVLSENTQPGYICKLIEEYKLEVLHTTPSFLNLMLLQLNDKGKNLLTLKKVYFGSEVMPESLLEKLQHIFPETHFIQTFGTSESGTMKVETKPGNPLFIKLGNNNDSAKIIDGELYIKSGYGMEGYLNKEAPSVTPDGFFPTGDNVEVDSEGFFRIAGRKDKVINVGGNKVNPMLVEEVLLKHPMITFAEVSSEKHLLMNQIVTAKVGTAENAKPSVQELRSHCRKFLKDYEIPVKISFQTDFEITPRLKKSSNT